MKLSLLIGIVALLFPFNANAEEVSVDGLAKAINGWRGGLLWWECGGSMDGIAGAERARMYASAILESAARYDHSPVVLSAIIEQESGYDECQIGRPSRTKLRLSAHPSRESILRVVGRHEVRRMDAGAAQFLWPSGSPYGVTDGVSLQEVLTMRWSVEALGKTLALHRDSRSVTGRMVIGGFPRTHGQVYWVLHNNPTYYNSDYYVRVRAKAMRIWRSLENS